MKKSGGKKGLAVAGMVIGIVSSVWCIILVLGISAAASMSSTVGSSDEWKDAMKQLENYEENN